MNPGKSSATTLPVVHKSGTLSTDETWSAGSVYMVDSTVTVPSGATLTIDHGAIVKYGPGGWSGNSIQVDSDGALDVTGTSGDPVVFTSSKDDSFGGDSTGDGSTTSMIGDYMSAISTNGGNVSVTYSVFHYGSTEISNMASGGDLSLSDSMFNDTYEAVVHANGDLLMQRNSFDVSPPGNNNVALDIQNDDLSGITLAGANQNTFNSRGRGSILRVSGGVPIGSTWVVSGMSDVVLNPTSVTVDGELDLDGGVTYAAGNYAFKVNGTMNITAGAIVKMQIGVGASNGISLNEGAILNVDGVNGSPVVFSSIEDDSVGGDTNGDGSTSGATGDFGTVIYNNGATVNVAYGIFRDMAVGIAGGGTDGRVSVSDSSFSNAYQGITDEGSLASLERNTFTLSPIGSNPAVYINDTDVTGIVLTGTDRNVFNGSGPAAMLSVSGNVPVGTTWIVGNTSNVILTPMSLTVDGTLNIENPVTYAFASNSSNPYAVNVNGTLNIAPGSIIKSRTDVLSNAFRVNNGGTLNVNGTSTNPIVFTSSADDSVGGDMTADGVTTGATGSYGESIAPMGGAINVSHSVFKYGFVAIEGYSNGNDFLTMTDSSVFHENEGIIYSGKNLVLQRNAFNIDPASNRTALQVQSDDLTGIVLSGSDKNTFVGSGPAVTILAKGTVPTGLVWGVSNSTNVILSPAEVIVDGTLNVDGGVTYISASNLYYNPYGITVNGVMNVAQDSILKIRKDSSGSNGIKVASGGDLELNGTNDHPVTITSASDDSVGGDTTGDGSSSASSGDYAQALNDQGGDVNGDYVDIGYGNTALVAGGGDITLGNATIHDFTYGINNQGSLITYRGKFKDIGAKAVLSCNWGTVGCLVDASYTDWDIATAPFLGGANVVCGQVYADPWINGGTVNNNPADVLFTPNCDNSDTTAASLDGRATNLDQYLEQLGVDCSTIQDACNTANRVYSCVADATDTARSALTISLPAYTSSESVIDYTGDILGIIGSTLSAGRSEVAGNAASGASDLISTMSVLVSLNSNYNSCLSA